MGMDKIRISVRTLAMFVNLKNATKLMQVPPGMVRSQRNATGVHWKAMPKMEVTPRPTLAMQSARWQIRHRAVVFSLGKRRR